MLDHLRRIVVEGPIGVGKTALARRLAQTLRTGELLDAARANPFLERFYRDPARYALQVQLAFLEQRAVQLREWQATLLSGKRVVGNFLGAKDKLFAQLTLPPDELALYEAAAARVPFAQRVDLVVVLQSTPAQLRERISRRNAPGEGSIDEAYLQRLCDAYVELLHRYDDAPVLIVDTALFNPVDNDLDFRTLLTRIDTMRGRKAFLNLAAP
jgi:deoxyguanosine kinase